MADNSFSLNHVLGIPARIPRKIQVEITNACNLNCYMCARNHFGVKAEHFPFPLFIQLINQLQEWNGRLDLTGWGEPLLYPHLSEAIQLATSVGSVSLTTNGTYLSKKNSLEIINAGLDSISISIDHINGLSSGHVPGGILEKVAVLLKHRKNDKPKVSINITYHQKNKSDVFKLITASAKVGVKHFTLLRLINNFNQALQVPSYNEEIHMWKKAYKLSRKLNVHLRQNFYSEGPLGFFHRKLRRLNYRFDSYCPITLDSIYIKTDGSVVPCPAMHELTPFGNITTSHVLKEIWLNENNTNFCKQQKQYCGTCGVYKLRPNNIK